MKYCREQLQKLRSGLDALQQIKNPLGPFRELNPGFSVVFTAANPVFN
jgi:hypothetical protein